jgi:hypothetical protein
LFDAILIVLSSILTNEERAIFWLDRKSSMVSRV